MSEPCLCPDCDDLATLAAWLWREDWGAQGPALSDEDERALGDIIDALARHWVAGEDKTATVEAARAEMANWRPRGTALQ